MASRARAEALAVDDARPDVVRLPVVALVGRPNVGKSTFVARLTGRYEEAANVPGTTVGTLRRRIRVGGRDAILVDLPGTHSLTDQSDGLPRFWQLLVDARPDAILAVVDAGNLALHLPLVLACRDLGLPIVVAANLADEAEAHGRDVDLGRLSQLLAAPVHRTVGRRGTGVQGALRETMRLADRRLRLPAIDAARPMTPVPPYPPHLVRAVGAMATRLRLAGDRCVVRDWGDQAHRDGARPAVDRTARSAPGGRDSARPAVLRKELALQLLLVLAIGEYGFTAHSLASFMSPGQLFVFAVVTGLSVPCVATIAALAGEFGWRRAAILSVATLGTAIGTGAIVARLVGAP